MATLGTAIAASQALARELRTDDWRTADAWRRLHARPDAPPPTPRAARVDRTAPSGRLAAVLARLAAGIARIRTA